MSGCKIRSGRRHPSPTGGFVFGILIIAVGVVMLLNTLGIVDARNFWDYVPLLLVALGIMKIVDARGSNAGLAFGGILALAGALWFLNNIGVFLLDKRLFFPLVIIGLGVVFLVRAVERQWHPEGGDNTANMDSRVNLVAIFGGIKRAIDSRDFHGGDLFAMFGGIELDLRLAQAAEEAIVVDANAIFGGVELRVPAHWNVDVKGMGIFGGYEDKTLHPQVDRLGPRFVVTGLALFGGVTVMNG